MLEKVILVAVWIVTILLLLLFTPRNKIREAIVIFLFKQVLTWMFGLLVVEFLLIEYPIRIFQIAIKSSFSFEFFIYPAICVIFILRFPKYKKTGYKIGWYLFFPTWMTIFEVLIEHYTNLIHYINWTWYWTWITLLLAFGMSQLFYLWFIKKQVPAKN